MQRLDLNLATRPFRNNTLIWGGYTVAATLLLGFAIWNGTTYRSHIALLNEKQSHLQDLEAQQADLDERERTAERERARKELTLETLTVQSLKANDVIEWKAFSWTELFNRLESALPWNVYMVAVRPVFRAEREEDAESTDSSVRSRPVAVEGYAKSLGALLDFERRLYASEYFDNPEPLRHAPDERGELVFTLRFTYYPDGRQRPAAGDSEGEAVPEGAPSAAAGENIPDGDSQDEDAVAPDGVGDDPAPPTIKRAAARGQEARP